MSICCSSDRSTTPGTPADGLAHALAEPAQRAQVVAEDLDGDVRARARQHVIDPVRDRLADRHVRAGQRRKPAPQLGEQLVARPLGLAQADVDLGRLDALHVLVELGAAGAARGRDDLRLREQDLLDAPADLVRLGQRRARQRVRLHRQAAFVELRQERRAHPRDRDARRRPGARAPTAMTVPRVIERVRQAPRRTGLERSRQPAVVAALDRSRVRQERVAQRRRDDDRHDQRREQRRRCRRTPAASAAGPRRRPGRRSAGTPAR